MNGGAFVLPIVHEVMPVNMNTLRLEVARGRDKALITKDRMRVDVTAEFYVRVQASPEAIAAAAQTLGQRTLQPETLKELVEGKFVDALRTVAAEMTMEEMHEKRGDYVKRVRAVVAADLLQNGLELETVSLTQLDQTAMEFFNPSNAFDAEGLTRLTETDRDAQEEAQRHRAGHDDPDPQQEPGDRAAVARHRPRRSSTRASARSASWRCSARRSAPTWRASGRPRSRRPSARRSRRARRWSARASPSERAVEEERIARERGVQSQEIERRQAIELAEQQRAIAVAEQSKAQSEAQAAADQARARAVTEEERVFTARETEMAERRKTIELIGAAQEAERDALRLTVAAGAEKAAANDRGAAVRAEGRSRGGCRQDPLHRREDPPRGRGRGPALMNKAQNVLTPEARLSAMRLRLIDKMEGIIRESVKPMERIEGIRILHVDGLAGGGGGGYGGGNGEASLADSVVNSALRFRAQAPLVDQLLREIGVEGGDVGKVARGMLEKAAAAPALGEDKPASGP